MKVSVETVDGCGVVGHHHTCLCDVIITKPTPINIKDGVADMWMGPQLCEIRGYGVPWLDMDIVDYFTDMLKGYDAWTVANIHIPSVDDPSQDSWDGRRVSRWKYIRNVMRQTLGQEPYKPKVALALDILGFTAEEFTAAATTNKCVWNMEKLTAFEEQVLGGFPSLKVLADEFGTTVEVCRNLFGYWGVPYKNKVPNSGRTPQAVARMNELFSLGAKPIQVCMIMESEYKYTISRFSASKAKRRYLDSLIKK